jgi:hypothetical protein
MAVSVAIKAAGQHVEPDRVRIMPAAGLSADLRATTSDR